jgi:plastocyanin
MRMQMKVVLIVAWAVGAAACGGGSSGGSGGQGAGGGDTKTTTTATDTATATNTTSTTTAAATVNGCDPSTAEDHTHENPMMLYFGGTAGSAYSPKCSKIKAGAGVMFMGPFATHPLAGGVDGVVDPTSPIKETKSGTMHTFDKLPAGVYGFFCEVHDAAGMNGAIFVE